MPPIEFAVENDLIAPARQERSRKSLDKIATAAEMILRRDGAEGFSVSAVAEVSGISIGGIYARVKGKRELFELVKLNSTARTANRIRTKMQAPYETPEAVVDGFVSALCAEFSRDENLHRALFSPGIASQIQHNHGNANRLRSINYFIAALIATCADLARLKQRDLEMVAELPVSYIMTSLTTPAESLDWEWVEQSLRIAAKAHLHVLIQNQALASNDDQIHAARADQRPQTVCDR